MYTQATAGRKQLVEIVTITEIPFKIRRMKTINYSTVYCWVLDMRKSRSEMIIGHHKVLFFKSSYMYITQ